MRARRALLYTPGDDLRKIQKAATLDVDCVCLDMEDGVAANRKDEARQNIAEALRTLHFERAERLARINPVGSGLEELDLRTVLPLHPDGIIIPKVTDGAQVKKISQAIAEFEYQARWTSGEIGLLIVVESARSIINLKEIASADNRLQAIIFGAEDYAGETGATRTPEGWEVFYARSAVVTHAAAFGLQSIDMVFTHFQDNEGLLQEALAAARLGFDGKQIIHPNQIIPVQNAFTPDEESIAYAQKVMSEYAIHQEAGKGAFALDGRMIDAPIVKLAQQVLERAKAARML